MCNGRVKGEQLFKCPFGHGSFLRPDRVKVSERGVDGDEKERVPHHAVVVVCKSVACRQVEVVGLVDVNSYCEEAYCKDVD